MNGLFEMNPFFFTTLGFLIIWTVIWKGIALWKSGRNNQLTWFIFLLVLNTAGILPILYLAFFQQESKESKRLRILEKRLEKK